MRNRAWWALLLVALSPGGGQAEDELPPALRSVSIDQRLNEQVPLDLTFRNELGQAVRLDAYFGSKPVILVLAYYRCPMLCNQVLNGLLDCLRKLSFDVGSQFQVVVVSFDPKESPPLAAAKKTTYIEQYGRPRAAGGWHFLTGDEASIRQLTQAVGFRYTYDATTTQYAHASGIMVVTPQGKLARYFFGVEYNPRDVQFAMMEATADRIGSPITQVLLFCYEYNPAAGTYTPAIRKLLQMAGILTVLALGTFILVSWKRERRRQLAPTR